MRTLPAVLGVACLVATSGCNCDGASGGDGGPDAGPGLDAGGTPDGGAGRDGGPTTDDAGAPGELGPVEAVVSDGSGMLVLMRGLGAVARSHPDGPQLTRVVFKLD